MYMAIQCSPGRSASCVLHTIAVGYVSTICGRQSLATTSYGRHISGSRDSRCDISSVCISGRRWCCDSCRSRARPRIRRRRQRSRSARVPPRSVSRCAGYPSAPGGSSRRRTRPALGRTRRTCSRCRNRRASTRCLRPARVCRWRRKGSRSCERTGPSRSSAEAVSPAPDVRRRRRLGS